MTRSRYKFGDDCYPHYITNTVVAWLPVFSRPELAQIILDSWQFLQNERDIDIFSFVIMENHVHWIATGPQLSRRVAEFKSFTAKQIIHSMKRANYRTLLQELKFYKQRHKIDQTYQLWQEGSHPKMIDTDAMMLQKIEYIHQNPTRRGFVDDPVHWRYSSARCYGGYEGLLEVCTDWDA